MRPIIPACAGLPNAAANKPGRLAGGSGAQHELARRT